MHGLGKLYGADSVRNQALEDPDRGFPAHPPHEREILPLRRRDDADLRQGHPVLFGEGQRRARWVAGGVVGHPSGRAHDGFFEIALADRDVLEAQDDAPRRVPQRALPRREAMFLQRPAQQAGKLLRGVGDHGCRDFLHSQFDDKL